MELMNNYMMAMAIYSVSFLIVSLLFSKGPRTVKNEARRVFRMITVSSWFVLVICSAAVLYQAAYPSLVMGFDLGNNAVPDFLVALAGAVVITVIPVRVFETRLPKSNSDVK